MDHPNPKKNTSALNAALGILARRNHTAYELREKLSVRGFSAADVDHAIHQCRRQGYVDDEATAQMWVEQLIRRGYGPLRIHQTLSRKGVAEEMIRKLLAQGENRVDDLEVARQALEKKRTRFERETDPVKRWQKACRFLANRGFSMSVIRKALEGFGKVDEE